MGSLDCRCVQGSLLDYRWGGETITHQDGETTEHAVARWFATKSANQELAWGLLSSHRFEKYKARMEAFVEEKLDGAAAGKLTPGTEVIEISRAQQQGAPMFEFRWHRDERQLTIHKHEQVRHYDAEPTEFPNKVFGLHMHLKDVRSENDDQILAEQNDEIDKAIALYRQQTSEGWKWIV